MRIGFSNGKPCNCLVLNCLLGGQFLTMPKDESLINVLNDFVGSSPTLTTIS